MGWKLEHTHGDSPSSPTPAPPPPAAADPAARPTVREVLEHAWCREGMALGTPQLLGFNDQLVGRAGRRGSPVEPEVRGGWVKHDNSWGQARDQTLQAA